MMSGRAVAGDVARRHANAAGEVGIVGEEVEQFAVLDIGSGRLH